MIVTVRTTLDRKYMTPGSKMIDPYTEERDGHLYLVSDTHDNPSVKRTAVLCDAIVAIAVIACEPEAHDAQLEFYGECAWCGEVEA